MICTHFLSKWSMITRSQILKINFYHFAVMSMTRNIIIFYSIIFLQLQTHRIQIQACFSGGSRRQCFLWTFYDISPGTKQTERTSEYTLAMCVRWDCVHCSDIWCTLTESIHALLSEGVRSDPCGPVVCCARSWIQISCWSLQDVASFDQFTRIRCLGWRSFCIVSQWISNSKCLETVWESYTYPSLQVMDSNPMLELCRMSCLRTCLSGLDVFVDQPISSLWKPRSNFMKTVW